MGNADRLDKQAANFYRALKRHTLCFINVSILKAINLLRQHHLRRKNFNMILYSSLMSPPFQNNLQWATWFHPTQLSLRTELIHSPEIEEMRVWSLQKTQTLFSGKMNGGVQKRWECSRHGRGSAVLTKGCHVQHWHSQKMRPLDLCQALWIGWSRSATESVSCKMTMRHC